MYSAKKVRMVHLILGPQRPQDLRWSEYQVELFVPLEHAEEALRATFKHAAERWGEFVQDPEALATHRIP